MDDLKKLVLAYIAKTQGKTQDEVSALLFKKAADGSEAINDNALDSLYELDKVRIQGQSQKFETEKKELYDKGYKKAQAESLAKFEKDLRDEYKITEDKQGKELVQAILAKQAKDTGTGEPTEDQVKRSKTYLDTIDSLKKEKEQAETEWKGKYESREKQLQKEATFKSISDQALKFLDNLNPILPEDPAIADKWKKIFLLELNDFDFETKDDGKVVVLKKEGDTTKAFLDAHGHPVAFEAMLKEKAGSLFKFKEGEQRGGTGNKTNPGGSGTAKGYNGPPIKTEAEYVKALAEAADDNARIEITKAFTGVK